MKSFIISLVLLCIIIIGIIFGGIYMKRNGEKCLYSLEKLSIPLYHENWTEADIVLEETENIYKKFENYLKLTRDHAELDKLKIAQIKLSESISIRDAKNARFYLAECKYLSQDLTKYGELSFINII